MEPLCVPPVDPGRGLQFDLLDALPASLSVDPLGLVEAIDGLGEGVVSSGFEPVLSMAVFDDGSGNALYVGGDFLQAGSLPANSIARWEGDGWSEVGSGFESGDEVRAMTVFDDGSGPVLVVGGSIDGTLRSNMAKWDGTAWTEMLGVNRRVTSLHVQTDGGNDSAAAI